jgi:hypothetical protein
MRTKTKMALATLLVFGSVSSALAANNDRGHHRGRARTTPTMIEERNPTTSHAVKPFTAEEKAWFDRASRVF